jgi:hypothetical protein
MTLFPRNILAQAPAHPAAKLLKCRAPRIYNQKGEPT